MTGLEKDGNILAAHCTCMAGLEKDGNILAAHYTCKAGLETKLNKQVDD